jgi:hypothetical protein
MISGSAHFSCLSRVAGNRLGDGSATYSQVFALRVNRYDALERHLSQVTGRILLMTFGQIEQLIGGLLPHAAIKRRAWWANDSQQEQARAWLNAGWRVEVVYQDRGLVTFMK